MLDCFLSFLGQLFPFPFYHWILRMTERVKILNILALCFQTDAWLCLNPTKFSRFSLFTGILHHKHEKYTWLCTSGKCLGEKCSPSCNFHVNQCSLRLVTTYRWQLVIHYGFLLACQTYKSLKVPFPSESAVKQSHPLLYLKEMDRVQKWIL